MTHCAAYRREREKVRKLRDVLVAVRVTYDADRGAEVMNMIDTVLAEVPVESKDSILDRPWGVELP